MSEMDALLDRVKRVSTGDGWIAMERDARAAQGTPEYDRIKDRLRAQISAPAAAQPVARDAKEPVPPSDASAEGDEK